MNAIFCALLTFEMNLCKVRCFLLSNIRGITTRARVPGDFSDVEIVELRGKTQTEKLT